MHDPKSVRICDQRQLVTTDCVPDAGVVSCLLGSDSHTTCPYPYIMFSIPSRVCRENRKKTNIAIRPFADELVLECGVWRQVHRRSPHGVVSRIERYLHGRDVISYQHK